MYSRVIVMGRITADLELRQTPSSVSVLSFRIAVNRPFVAKNGERATDFFNVVAWRAQAEFIAKYFKKGSLILVDGRLESREYVDKNGTMFSIPLMELILNVLALHTMVLSSLI